MGPVWRGGHQGEPELLASCYATSLQRAVEVGAAGVAFPAISTGVFGYPVRAAAEIAVSTVRSTAAGVDHVRFVCFDEETWQTYEELLRP